MFDPAAYERQLGQRVAVEDLRNPRAVALARLLSRGDYQYARLVGCYRTEGGRESIKFEVDVERPQRPVAPIARRELMVARIFDDNRPNVYALRPDFPSEALHLNMNVEGDPPWLCLDERPWEEVRARWTAFSFAESVRWWLAKTARGDLHGEDQAAEPVFWPQAKVIVPPALLTNEWSDKRVLEVYSVSTSTEPSTIVLQEAGAEKRGGATPFLPIFLYAKPQPMQRLRSEPKNIKQLHDLLSTWGIDLLTALRTELKRVIHESPGLLTGRPLLLLYMPLLRPDGTDSGKADLKAFTSETGGDIAALGVALGVYLKADVGPVVQNIAPDLALVGESMGVATLGVQANYSRLTAEVASGLPADERRVTLVGGGAIGSHVFEIMRRDGFGKWTVIDNDAFLPHNVQRHRGPFNYVGKPKAAVTIVAVDAAIGAGEESQCVIRDVLSGREDSEAALAGAELIIDASASIPVSRYLADNPAPAPRASVFFNVVGQDAVLIGEDPKRDLKLDALEAQYYRAILENDALADHIAATAKSYHYAGTCRSVSFQMPEHQVSMLSGAMASEMRRHIAGDQATIAIWVGDAETGLRRMTFVTHPVHRRRNGEWEILVDDGLIAKAAELRQQALPSETGGILMGTIDVARRQICVVQIVAAPSDSVGDEEGFERGTKNLKSILEAANKRIAGQVEYLGEWHSHPVGVKPEVSTTDVKQLAWLGLERTVEDLPALMLIVGDDKRFNVYTVEEQHRHRGQPEP